MIFKWPAGNQRRCLGFSPFFSSIFELIPTFWHNSKGCAGTLQKYICGSIFMGVGLGHICESEEEGGLASFSADYFSLPASKIKKLLSFFVHDAFPGEKAARRPKFKLNLIFFSMFLPIHYQQHQPVHAQPKRSHYCQRN